MTTLVRLKGHWKHQTKGDWHVHQHFKLLTTSVLRKTSAGPCATDQASSLPQTSAANREQIKGHCGKLGFSIDPNLRRVDQLFVAEAATRSRFLKSCFAGANAFYSGRTQQYSSRCESGTAAAQR